MNGYCEFLFGIIKGKEGGDDRYLYNLYNLMNFFYNFLNFWLAIGIFRNSFEF